MRKLMTAPSETVAHLRQHIQPVPGPDAKRLTSLIADLDSETFVTRDMGMKELTKIGDLAGPALREALEKSPSAEVRRRIEQLLGKLENIGASGERLRQARAVEVLERIGTSEAREMLGKLAEGAPGAWLTREAKASFERLQQGHPAP
jgi:hypothetical protein